MNFSSADVLVTISATNGASVIVCMLAAIFVGALKLHRLVIYRLAMYQVLSALFMAVMAVIQVVFVNYNDNPVLYGRVCVSVGWFTVYSQWVKLLFTVCVTVHVFCFGVFGKDLKKLEVPYVVISMLAPAAIASVPLATKSYGLGPFGCWIHTSSNSSLPDNGNTVVERFVLWDGPALVILLMASVAMVVLVIKLGLLVYHRAGYSALNGSNQYWNALKQVLPLAAFPILFCVFIIPQVMFHIYQTSTNSSTNSSNQVLSLVTSVFFSLWSMASGVTLIVHISVARYYRRKAVSLNLHRKSQAESSESSLCTK